MNDENATVTKPENGGPILQTPSSKPALPSGRGRIGKIARLPLAVRRQLNQRLQDGQTGGVLLQWLNGLPEVQAVLAAQFDGQPLTKMNLSRWKQGGYRSWEQEQKTLAEMAALFEKSAALQEAAKDGLTDRMALVLAAKMAVELNRLDSLPDGKNKSAMWRDLLGCLAVLRRGEFHGERLRLEREKIAFRRELRQKELEMAFWQWADKPENRPKLRERLLSPAENLEVRTRRMEEKRRRIKQILGIH